MLTFCSLVREFDGMFCKWASLSVKYMSIAASVSNRTDSPSFQTYWKALARAARQKYLWKYMTFSTWNLHSQSHTLSIHQTKGQLHLLAYRNQKCTASPFRRWNTFLVVWWWEYVNNSAAITHLVCLHGCFHSLHKVALLSFAARLDWQIVGFLKTIVSLLPTYKTINERWPAHRWKVYLLDIALFRSYWYQTHKCPPQQRHHGPLQ